jgi:hypothetical protein
MDSGTHEDLVFKYWPFQLLTWMYPKMLSANEVIGENGLEQCPAWDEHSTSVSDP